jgi:hypothetical protein
LTDQDIIDLISDIEADALGNLILPDGTPLTDRPEFLAILAAGMGAICRILSSQPQKVA